MSKYRAEIQGVRAIAALLVATFHIWLGRVSGGVDVFFVMSGYLITLTLFGHLQRFGHVKPILYLTRLLRRLLPAALTVLLAALIGTWLFLPEVAWQNTTREIIAATLYFENWQLAGNAVNYLAQFDSHTIVQHFWAMSIQGQFYLIWLMMFFLIGAISRRWPIGHQRTATILFSILICISLFYSIWATKINQPHAYFDTRARVWEFALGGLAAVNLQRVHMARTPRIVLGWLGLLGILFCGFLLKVSTIFPGYAALWPTGCALLILATGGTAEPIGAESFLSRKPLVWLGNISYGIYLWHWPILVFFRETTGHYDPGLRSGVAILALSILLAWLTRILIEDPIQKARSTNRHSHLIFVTCTVALMVGLIGGSFLIGKDVQARIETNLVLTDQRDSDGAPAGNQCFGAAALHNGSAVCPLSINDRNILPMPAAAPQLDDAPCALIEKLRFMTACSFGAPIYNSIKTILLIGDSHSMSWRVVVDEIARHNRWHAIAISESGCLPSMTPRVSATKGLLEHCVGWNREMIEWVNKHPEIDTLFTIAASGRTIAVADKMPLEKAATTGYLNEWAAMKAIRRIVVLRDSPRLAPTVLTCVERSIRIGSNPARNCKYPRQDAVLFDPAANAAKSGHSAALTHVVDLTDNFCDAEYCYPVIGGLLAYKDSVHLNRIFARTLAPYAIAQVDKIMPSETYKDPH